MLVPAEQSGAGKEILVTRGDIREIQLAKAAIRAGVEALLNATATKTDDIERFLVAGAFGTYLNLDSALQVGMFPPLPRERFHQIGNAAGAGALEMLLSTASRVEAESIIDKMTYTQNHLRWLTAHSLGGQSPLSVTCSVGRLLPSKIPQVLQTAYACRTC